MRRRRSERKYFVELTRDTHLRDRLAKLHCRSRAVAGGGAVPSQTSLDVTSLAVGDGETGEHGLLEREACVPDTGRHIGLGRH